MLDIASVSQLFSCAPTQLIQFFRRQPEQELFCWITIRIFTLISSQSWNVVLLNGNKKNVSNFRLSLLVSGCSFILLLISQLSE